ncbi:MULTISPECIES: hypothetical protein [Aerosakkonema]|uniref:hypothetical protein n=1 Tax=Aerosakkonema TaxID=1246629 RepID=UPI0035BBBA24
MLPHESGFEKTSPGEPVGISTGNCVDPSRSSVFWDEIPCNPLTVVLDRRMLLEGGYQ